MPEIRNLTRPKATPFTVDLGDGDSINGTFDRNMVTPAWVTRGREQQFLSEALAEVILSWDVTNDAAPYAISAENMAVFSFDAQARLLEIIVEASVPSRAEGNGLSAPTGTAPTTSTVPEQTSPNGQVPSPQPELSASPSPT
jgi:hypothetical protein